jgi:hypothetical protein
VFLAIEKLALSLMEKSVDDEIPILERAIEGKPQIEDLFAHHLDLVIELAVSVWVTREATPEFLERIVVLGPQAVPDVLIELRRCGGSLTAGLIQARLLQKTALLVFETAAAGAGLVPAAFRHVGDLPPSFRLLPEPPGQAITSAIQERRCPGRHGLVSANPATLETQVSVGDKRPDLPVQPCCPAFQSTLSRPQGRNLEGRLTVRLHDDPSYATRPRGCRNEDAGKDGG